MMRIAIVLFLAALTGCAEPISTEHYRVSATVIATHYSYDGGGVGITTGGSMAITMGSGDQYAMTIEYENGEREVINLGKRTFLKFQQGDTIYFECREETYESGKVYRRCSRQPIAE